MAIVKETSSFLAADRRIDALLHKLNARGVCGCCTARALLLRGAELMEENAGSAESITFCEEIIEHLRENAVPEPPDQSGISH